LIPSIHSIFKQPTFIESDFVPTRWSQDMLLALRIYIGLKLFIVCFALFTIQIPQAESLNPSDLKLYQAFCLFIFTYTLIQGSIVTRYKQPLKRFTFLFFALDIVLIAAISHFQLATQATMPLLMYVCIAAAAMILRLKLGLSLAIFAITLVSADKFLLFYIQNLEIKYNQLAIQIVGILFSCYFLAILARRAHSAEIEKFEEEERSKALIDINHELVQNLNTGIIVVNKAGIIETCNPAAMNIFTDGSKEIGHLKDLDHALYKEWLQWSDHSHSKSIKLSKNNIGSESLMGIVFSPLGEKGDFSKITLHTESSLREQAQQYSLERMGRMASAIAHEIRNPLTSISAASELLSQENIDKKTSEKSIEIIGRNSSRINNIIEDVLDIGRSKKVDMEEFNIAVWLKESFIPEYDESHQQKRGDSFKIKKTNTGELSIHFSKSHLKQVLGNLCDNAFIHGEITTKQPLTFKIENESNNISLEVFNHGNAIDKAGARKLFEPFFTTREQKGGTGLGLYLCKQICELNLATIQHKRYGNGNGFIIEFHTNNPLSQ